MNLRVLMSREMLDGKREQSQLLGVRCVQKVKIITLSALKMANSTIVTVLVWRKILAIPDGETVPYLV
ncbi:putative peptidoglycan-binding peptidase [Escherichia coli]|uniref:Putative peptidoglycan-binding peptidase n=1 Tax=Escherichia coli TaxID=562 RepID=A0A376P7J1_ECOLX|nr:putative peptidoglycan-binding peptidase [Escherichia coli]